MTVLNAENLYPHDVDTITVASEGNLKDKIICHFNGRSMTISFYADRDNTFEQWYENDSSNYNFDVVDPSLGYYGLVWDRTTQEVSMILSVEQDGEIQKVHYYLKNTPEPDEYIKWTDTIGDYIVDPNDGAELLFIDPNATQEVFG